MEKQLHLHFKQGSILVYSLIVLAMMFAIVGSMSSVSILENKSAGSSQNSAQAFQTADSGVQLAIKRINDNMNGKIQDNFGSGNCSTGTVSLNDAGAGSYTLNFYTTGSTTAISDCGALVNTIASIQSVGTYGGTVRAVSVAVNIPVAPCSATTTCGTSCSYNGTNYPTASFASACWMTENLNTTKDASGHSIVRGCFGNGDCSGKDPNNNLYGGLYDWSTALALPPASNCDSSDCSALIQTKQQGICPNGWHVPSKSEWQGMLSVYTNNQIVSGGTSGYNAPLAGYYSPSFGEWMDENQFGFYWAATQNDANDAFYLNIYNAVSGGPAKVASLVKNDLDSVRCTEN